MKIALLALALSTACQVASATEYVMITSVTPITVKQPNGKTCTTVQSKTVCTEQFKDVTMVYTYQGLYKGTVINGVSKIQVRSGQMVPFDQSVQF